MQNCTLLVLPDNYIMRVSMLVALSVSYLSYLAGCHGIPINPQTGFIPIEDVTFQLYNRQNSNPGNRVIIGDRNSFEEAGFDPDLPTKILVHGWMDDIQSGVIQLLKKEFLALQPMNVFGVGWPACSRNVLYEQAVECSKQVGRYIGDLTLWLNDAYGVAPDTVHGIGHSLGGQAISFASQKVKMGHISALDPAAPLFTHEKDSNRLDLGDGDFVDVFHTSIKLVGFKEAAGTVDFYPNGGAEQPGCGGIFGSCAHSAAYYFYAHTISAAGRNEYMAYKCDSVHEARNATCTGEPRALMGYGASPKDSGIYYMNITSVPYPSML